MQRIFDVDNKKDMQDLWDILPDDVEKIEIEEANGYNRFCYKKVGACEHSISSLKLIAINWHDKTEITRPVNYDDMIGCVGWFWDGEQKPARPVLSVLWRCDFDGFWTARRELFEHFMTAQKSELKFYGEQDD